jgi:non-homologous end joining protein Ku
MADGSLVEITDADPDALPLESVRAIEVLGFNPSESINPTRIGKAYYLAAHGPVAAKPYSLIVKALERNAKAAIARYSLRDRERLGLLRVKDGVLVLHQLLAADEVRSPCAVAPQEESLPDDELQSALDLTDALTTDDLSGLSDHYTEALEEVITAKLEGTCPGSRGAGTASAGGQSHGSTERVREGSARLTRGDRRARRRPRDAQETGSEEDHHGHQEDDHEEAARRREEVGGRAAAQEGVAELKDTCPVTGNLERVPWKFEWSECCPLPPGFRISPATAAPRPPVRPPGRGRGSRRPAGGCGARAGTGPRRSGLGR